MASQPEEHGVAVIGLGALFPGAPDAAGFWDNIAAGRDAIREASPHRLDPGFLDPASGAVDRLPTLRGGFVDDPIQFDASGFGIMPVVVPSTDPDQLLTLAVASAALADAGLQGSDLGGSTVAVILGRGGYLTPAMARLGRKARDAEQLARILRQTLPDLADSDVLRVKRAFQEASGAYGPDTALGIVPNLTASRVANRLDLHGPAYTVDAACASSLVAVEHAMRELRSGRCDLAIAGGVHLVDDVPFWAVFSQLGALSRSGTIRPFDRRADGLLVGEGIGTVVLKRLDKARRDGDRVYAVLWGVGSSSDGRAATVMVPRTQGQVLALRRAWADAGLDPSEAELIEAHGTATAAGDSAEVATLLEVFGASASANKIALGSVKSMIGHAMPAAGAAGLIKTVLAVHHGVLPPSLHCEEPREDLRGSRFEVLGAAREWAAERRVAGVNAFGFGGINAHVVVGSHGAAARTAGRRAAHNPLDRADADVLALAAPDPETLLAMLDDGVRRGGEGPCRLAMVDPTGERLARARRVVERGAPWAGRGGMWFRREGLIGAGGRVAFVFPGIEASFSPEIETVAARFGLAAPRLGKPEPGDLAATGRGVVALGRFLDRVVRQLGLQPDLYLGHSVGEWTGMFAAGLIPADDIDAFLGRFPFQSLEVPDVLFAAAGCGIEAARQAIEGLTGIAVSHDNCPHQVILCGHGEPVAIARERLLADGVMCQVLPFRSGFHSPLFADYLAPHVANLRSLAIEPAHTPLWSATTLRPYPDEPDAVRALVLEHLVAPLRFRELTEALYASGTRVFVQLGVGSIPGFVSDTLGSRPHLAVSASEDRRSGIAQIRNLLLALFVEGAEVDPLAATPRDRRTVPVALGVPVLSLDLDPIRVHTDAPAGSDPLSVALAETQVALSRGPQDVIRALGQPRVRRTTVPLSVRDVPALIDHSFFPQRSGWPVVSDWRPVVPMTMTVTLLCEAAEAARPGHVVVELTDVRALRWVAVEPPVEVSIEVKPEGQGWFAVRMEDYAEARIRLAPSWPERPEPSLPDLADGRTPPHTAEQMYFERWMFHGPRYQGIVGLDAIDEGGLDATLAALPAPGALLDAAGQLVGYWLLATQAQDRLTMPTGCARMLMYGPRPPDGARVQTRVRVLDTAAQSVRADLELVHEGRLWCRLLSWSDHRFDSDDLLLSIMRQPEHHLLSDRHGDAPGRSGFSLFDDQAHRVPSRDWLGRRYLGESERDALHAAGPRLHRRLLDDRIAAKDAIRSLLWAEGHGPLFPAEVSVPIADPDSGVIEASVVGVGPLWVAVDHLDNRSVAVASRAGRPGIAIGRAGGDTSALVHRVTEQAGGGEVSVEEVDGYVVAWAAP